jgi:hypothetical protein
MQSLVLGKKPLDFKGDNGDVKGVQLHISRSASPQELARGFEGLVVEKVFVAAASGLDVSGIKVGRPYDFQYESYGGKASLVSITPAKVSVAG